MPVTYPCSDKQASFITRLLAERVPVERLSSLLSGRRPSDLSKREASLVIEALLASPKAEVASEPVAAREYVGPGFYEVEGVIYRVVPSRGSGRNYAKQLHFVGSGTGAWRYAPGVMAVIREEHRVALDRAKDFGRTHGFCIVCGRLLTDPVSIANGIGPVCESRI